MKEESEFSAADPGFAVLAIDDLLLEHDDLISRIRLCFGIDAEGFNRDVIPLIRNYAGCAHLLPATPDNYFRDPGGLLALGLQVAFFSLQGTDAHIFSGRSTISVRRQLEPRWRLATFVGGLCCELHRLLSHLVVVDQQGREWPGYLSPLGLWLHELGTTRYYVRWKPQAIETRGLGLIVMPQVVPAVILQYLNDGNSVIVPHLLASIGGVASYRDHNVLEGLVRRSLALVIDRSLLADASRYGSPQFGSHLERYLVDAIRRLGSDDPAWVANRDRSRVWFGRDGLFLAWPAAAADIVALLEADQLAGIPKAPETMLEILSAAGVLEPAKGNSAIWCIQPPSSRTSIDAVKLTSTAILFAGPQMSPEPLSERLVCSSADPPANTTAAAPKPTPVGTQLSLLQNTPQQLTSPDDRSSPPSPPASPATNAEPPTPAQPATHRTYALKASMRLNPAVRDALENIILKFESADPASTACTVASGLFIPLSEFENRGIQAALAIRALTELQMLVRTRPDGPPTLTHGADASATVGLVISPNFVEGFDPEAFVFPSPVSP